MCNARLVLAAMFLVAFAAACGDGDEVARPAQSAANADHDRLARELAAAHFNGANENLAAARAALQPLVERASASPSDLIDAAVVELQLGKHEEARALLTRAAQLDAQDPRLHYNLGRVAELAGDSAGAAEHFGAALQRAPEDAPTKLHLFNAIEESDPARAEKLLREIVARGVDVDGPWYSSALFKLGNLLRRSAAATEDAGLDFLDEFQRISATVPVPKEKPFALGNLGRIAWPEQSGAGLGATAALPSFGELQLLLPEFAGAQRVFASDLDHDGVLDLIGYGARGLVVGLQRANFTWEARKLVDAPIELALACDIANDGALDLVYSTAGELKLLRVARDAAGAFSGWTPWTKALPKLASPPLDALAFDYDHEGDLDLLFVGDFGALLLRNDGAASSDAKGTFTDVTEAAQLPRGRAFAWCVSEDFDVDQDVDALLGSADSAFLATNLRGGKFGDASASLGSFTGCAPAPLAADYDGDARPDLWSSTGGGALYLGKPSGVFAQDPSYVGPALPALAARGGGEFFGLRALQAVDLDFDGALDLVWSKAAPEGQHLRGQFAPGFAQRKGLDAPTKLTAPAALIADLDGDQVWDLIALGEHGVEVQRGGAKANNALRLGLLGKKDNRRGIGAVVEVVAQRVYRRIYWRGEATLVGVGGEKEVDVVRITWPNGVVQYELRRDLGDRASAKDKLGLAQSEGLVGSCPFLYTWNGAKYEFISDVLGITPLGLPMAPGMLVPPDHDEFVLVRGEQLQPKDGFYELQFTEELREVTYLDRARLDVVDHPADSEIFPNELFTFPPFPEAHTHTVRGALAPTKALGSDGKDWSSALAKIDDVYAVPFEPAPAQFLGLATPHTLELAFDAAKVKSAKRLRLVMTGWFFWTDASVNMASAYDPEQEFVPPILELPDGAGGWKAAGPPIGFPAGKTKTMVLDVTQLLSRDEPRLRLFSTLRLYWDSIRLAVDDDDATLDVRSLEVTSANLWRRGFSAPLERDKPNLPERFDWAKLTERPRWNQHPGAYTKYGETLPLLANVDDEFVILGAGDALTLRFDARALPPLKPGQRRDFLLFLDGWAKDRDPNTIEALHVEPLPFHAMSGYPYASSERFPDDVAHRKWRAQWNTRASYDWFGRLAPR